MGWQLHHRDSNPDPAVERRRGPGPRGFKPAKDKSTERIDGIVAAIMAIGRAMVAQEDSQPEYSLFFV